MSYAIISLGGKQYRVQEGQRLLVDRLPTDEGKTFQPEILLLGGSGEAQLGSAGATVTARVVQHTKGKKIRIGKYRPKNGYKRHTGFRASLSQIEIEAIGAGKRAAPAAAKAKPAPAPAPAPAADAAAPPKGLPKDYEGMTVAAVTEGAKGWNRPMLEAALAYEQEHGKRKGALAALESALAAKEEAS